MEQHIPVYKSGEDLKNDLEQLPVGTQIIYHGVPHEVVDAGNQGHRVAAIHSPESWEITSIEDRKGYDIEIFLKGSREDVIATVYDENHALLIVRAPEMLDVLKSCKVFLDDEDSGDTFDLYERVLRIITKATNSQ